MEIPEIYSPLKNFYLFHLTVIYVLTGSRADTE